MKRVGIVGTMVIFLFTLGTCTSQQVPQTLVVDVSELPQQRTENLVLVETVEGKPSWKLEADLALIYEEPARTDLQKVKLTFYQDGQAISTLSSSRGIMYKSSGDLEALGEVVVISGHGRLESERILWDASAERLTSPDFVKITRANRIITGFGLEADPNLEKVRIDRDVKVKVSPVKSQRDIYGARVK